MTTEMRSDKQNGGADREETEREKYKKCEDPAAEKDGENDEKREKKEKKGKRGKRHAEVVIPDDGVPYDRGYAWMIVLAGFMNLTLLAGYNRGIFIFFVNFLEEFRAPVTETALLFGVRAAVNSVVGLFIMNAVVGRFGVRRTVMVGGVCLSLSAILGSFANDVTSLILGQAVFHGLGMSMLGMPITVLMGFYFRRRRSLALSIMKCGVGAGAVAFPPTVTFLLNQYGLRGALLIMGGVCLNTLVVGSLLRPTSFYKKLKLRRNEECAEKLLDSAPDRDEDSTAKTTENGTVKEISLKNGIKAAHDGTKDTHANKIVSDEDSTAKTTENGTVKEISLKNGIKAAQDDTKDTHANKIISFDKATEVSVIKDATVHENGCQNGSSVIVIEEDGLPVSVHGPGGEKRTLLVHHTDGVTMLSRSTPELHLERMFRPRTFSVNNKYYSSTPQSSGEAGSVLDALSRSHLARYLSRPDLEHDTPCIALPADLAHAADDERAGKKRSCLQQTWRVVKKIFGVLDFSLFHSPMFRLLVVFFVTSPMLMTVTTYLPAMAKERGLDENQRAVLLSIIGGLDFCCRLICGFIADTKVMKVSTMIGIAFAILGVMCQLTRFLTSFSLLVILAVAQGMLGGVAACVMPILIMEDIGLDNTAKAMGFNKLFSGAAMAAFHPLLGYIRDTTGSYDMAYNVIGAFTLVSAAVIVCVRFLPHTLPTDDKEEVITFPDADDTESSPLNPEMKKTPDEKQTS